MQVSLVRICVTEKVERNGVTKLGYLSYFKSSVSVSLRSGSKYSSPTSSTQNKAPAPGLKSSYIMSSLFKSSSISPSGADLGCHPPCLFHSSFCLGPCIYLRAAASTRSIVCDTCFEKWQCRRLFASIWMRRANLGKTNWVQPRGRPLYPVIF